MAAKRIIPKPKLRATTGRVWSESDIRFYVSHFPHMTNKELAFKLNRTVRSIGSYREDNGMLWLRKTPELLCRIKSRSNASRTVCHSGKMVAPK